MPKKAKNQKNQGTILITGGAGIINSNTLEYLFNKYPTYRFVVLDLLPTRRIFVIFQSIFVLARTSRFGMVM